VSKTPQSERSVSTPHAEKTARGAVAHASRRSRGARNDLQAYFDDINRYPLLTAEQERELGWAIINEGDEDARQTMIRSNLRLVVAIAKRYANRGVPLNDLIEEGNIGLMRAVEGFDPAQGARFSTYASWWIKQGMKRAFLTSSTQAVHVPAYMVELIAKWKVAYHKLESELGTAPSMQDLASELNIPVAKIRIIRRAIKAFQNPATMRGPAGESVSITEMVADSRHATPDEQVFQSEELAIVRKLMETLSERDATVLRLRFGLDGSDPCTLKEISDEVGLSRERVRQVIDEALTRLNQQLTGTLPRDQANRSSIFAEHVMEEAKRSL
jgi:RNA polymerase primary sigma factor